MYDDEGKKELLKNVVLVGGPVKVQGFKERMERDLRRECPVEMKIRVKVGKGACEGVFNAMQNIAKTHK